MSVTDPHDAEWETERIERARQGSLDAFESLVRRHEGRLFRFLLARAACRADAEDALQETFAAAYRYLDTYRSRWAFSTWLYRIARNRFLDQQRQGWRWLGLESLEGRDGVPDPELEQLSDAREVRQALQRLPERQRSALLLSYYEGLSQKEVAQVLGLGLRAVESLIVRARRALGKTLEEQHARTP